MEVEENPTWMLVVALALVDERGRWLMHKRPAGKHHAGLWEFPGGKVESGETPANALVREIAEELGLALAPGSLEPSGFAQNGGNGAECAIVILLYTCRDWSGQPRALEGGEIGWFAPEEAAGLDKPPLDHALLGQLSALLAGPPGDRQS
ncbi:DNA mismatch repair protein MutT [Erythrobacter sp. QSSC1-22B]|uniref:(deoxy)nucleoside triphosphate pyrophosphohydrolase n=1 Tax=Erythrobacter sp. QSSC1-22B TaxID=1860125 RepID=UPI000805CE00|nr:(deoxy)nucleoside triphosphate pyrophosphohydrolase [Erythrobacter sp. QSSC1-22B]OBX20645.1 DNA mismatch repair protein MutT [Erythrobacter sp. QSSC1-22B]